MSLFSDNQEFNRFNRKKKATSSEERLANANLSQSDSDISPKMSRDAKTIKSVPAEKVKPKAKPKADDSYKMPKQTTPDMDTSQGNYGSRSSFDEGEVAPKAAIVVEAAPVEERYVPRAKEETSRFSASNPMGMKRGGTVGSSKASSRGDGCAQRGKTKGRLV